MAEVNENCEFTVKCDCVKLSTQTNGDIILIRGINLSQEQATSLAWLINNSPSVLEFEIKLRS